MYKTTSAEEYLQGSKEGKWCGILGCPTTPTVKCSCGAMYCKKHSKIHRHVVK